MSRTHRKVLVSFCDKCDKPTTKYFGYTVTHGDNTCTCIGKNPWDGDLGRYRKMVKVYDTCHYYSIGDWKKIWNRKQRLESKNILHKLKNSYNSGYPSFENYYHPLDNYAFPISKNQAAWDAY